MFIPAKAKYRKHFKVRVSGTASRGVTLVYGNCGLKVIDCCKITSKQLEAARRSAMRTLKRVGKLWIRIFPQIPVSKKPADVRMGKGKGSVEYWVAPVQKGVVLFELADVSLSLGQEAMRKAASKLPVRTKFVTSFDVDLSRN